MKTNYLDFSILKDTTFKLGLILFAISTSIFLATDQQVFDFFGDELALPFFFNYGIVFIYAIALMGNNKANFGGYFRFRNLRKNLILLLLFNVSAYSLNRSLPVFQDSTEWLQIGLVALNTSILLFCFRPKPLQFDWLNVTILIVLSLGLVLQLYQSFYLIPFYAITVISFWFFGISLHSLVAIWFVVTLFKMIWQYFDASDIYRRIALGSAAIPLIAVTLFGIKWNNINHIIEQGFHQQHQVGASQELPNWVSVSQQLDNSWITKRALKSKMVFTVLDIDNGGLFFPSNSFGNRVNEPLQHDPLVVMAALIFGEIDLTNQDKFQLYQATFNARHQTEERLWSGDHLVTSDIVTNVELFPEHRLSYTEKTFNIKNTLTNSSPWRSRNTQEAVYSFYLPEGAVVTSSSLWIEGVEEKSYLTTRSKADSAYKAIVGVERRDPLLLHWQEGNRISVKIFPCTPQEDRMFKIGITAPLHFENGKLEYQNIDFEGPNWANAKESIHVLQQDKMEGFKSSLGFDASDEGWKYFGKYQSDWNIKMDAPPLAYSTFSFNERSLRVQDLLPLSEKFSPEVVYLDVNGDWSKSQCRKIYEAVQGKEVYVFDGKLKLLTNENYKSLFKKLRKKRFSLFPFHQIKNVENALVITQGKQFTPSLKDIKKSKFTNDLKLFLAKNNVPIRLYNLGDDLTIYLKTLRELKTFNFQKGNLDLLLDQLKSKRFPKYQDAKNIVSIPSANIQIETMEGTPQLNNAPDHLLRLFAYNDLMKKIGKRYFEADYISEELIGQAKESYVVTPISSMIVLETQKDYDRFDIKKSENSLQNASLGNSGSVPEPHEWLLILLCVATLLFLKFNKSAFVNS